MKDEICGFQQTYVLLGGSRGALDSFQTGPGTAGMADWDILPACKKRPP